MDVGAVNAKEPTGEEDERYSAAEWAAWWSEETAQGQWQEAPHLDALGKGKGSKGGKGGKGWGKGKGADAKGGGKGYGARPPLVCNRCGGTGHPERVCPTVAGSTSTTKCSCCLGAGHCPYLIASFIFVGIYYFFLKVVLYAIQKLENKWVVDQRWVLIRIFIVFAFTGSSSVFVGRPFIKWIGITKDNLYPLFYWILFIIISLFFYQLLLVVFGWLFGQFKFFWNFEKKMLRRFGLGKFLKD